MGVQGLGLNTAGVKPLFGSRHQQGSPTLQWAPDTFTRFGDSLVRPEARVNAFEQRQKFRLDPFQTKAMTALASGRSVVVPTPTSSGKTLVAEFAINEVLDPASPSHGKKLAYTTPRKALSNEKYEDLVKQYGEENIGLMTGDVTINRNAPVIVMTTEVLRNMFYDPKAGSNEDEVTSKLQYAVFDECHFIDDADRGVVWEESMLYVPKNIQQVHLSATVENAGEYTEWLSKINGQPFDLIDYETHDLQQQRQGRPVPLVVEYLSPEGSLVPVLKGSGQNPAFKKNFQPGKFDIVRAVKSLRDHNRLPAILFAFGRNSCEDYAGQTAAYFQNGLMDSSEQLKISMIVTRFKAEYPWLEQSPLLGLLPKGVAYHHGGMLPYEKKLVEVLMKQGLLKAVFATDTLAAGINVPAKTVVLTSFMRNIDGVLTPISNSDYQQIIGRAGRRGMYNTGFAVMMHPRDNNRNQLLDLAKAGPNAVNSRFRITPGMALNLIESRGPNDIDSMLERTFSAHQQRDRIKPATGKKARRREAVKQQKPTGPSEAFRQMRRFLQKNGFLTGNKQLEEITLTPAGKVAAALPTDHNLLISRSINKGAFDNLNPAQFAAVISTLVTEPKKEEANLESFASLPPVYESLTRIKDAQRQLMESSADYMLVDLPNSLGTDYVGTIRRWCENGDFDEILAMPAPGDIVNVIRRTANVLRHIAESPLDDGKHGALKEKARQAQALLLQDPLPALVKPKLINTDA